MAPMVNVRAVPTAWRSATARGEHQVGRSIRTIWTRGIATNAAIREPGAEVPGGIPPVPVPQRQSALERRIAAVDKTKPFSDFLTDTFNRQHDYLRISITERCNLRCLYCMPEEGIPLSPAEHMLTTPEIFYLSSLFVSQGVTKIRLTGGEPTVRRDIVPLMQQIGSLRANGLRELALTTNGIALHRKLDAMVESGLTGINLSLDTLDPFQFQIMTRRNGFDAVMKSINRVLEMNKLGANVKLKVNCVVMRGLNEREIIPFVEMGREKDIEVRFIEYMPFGGNKWSQGKMISFQEMLDIIRTKYPDLRSVPGHKNDTSKTFEVPGFVGKVGFITSMTNDFCGTCNRLRITSDGNLKVCLHGNAEVSLRDVLRQGNDGKPIDQEAFERIKQIEMDRHEGRLSDETILGWGQRERDLLDVIGAAVKRKAEKHADMGDLENMTNRPMILIDETSSSQSWFHHNDHSQYGSQITRASRPAFQIPPLSPASPYSFLSATPSHNLVSRRAYSGSNLGRDELDFLESGGLKSAARVRSVQSKTRSPGHVKEKSSRVKRFPAESHPDPFSVKGVRRVQDMRSKPFDPVSKHLSFDPSQESDIVIGEDSFGDGQDPRNESLSYRNEKRSDTIEAQARKGLAENNVKKQEKSEQKKLREEPTLDAQQSKEQAVLLAIWQHGFDKASLPRHLETIRQKYNMAGQEYRYYWRLVAGSWLTGAAKVPGAYDRARNYLRRMEKSKGRKHVFLTEDGEEISLHLKLMKEASLLAAESRKEDAERGEEATEDAGMQATLAEHGQQMTKRQKWRLNKQRKAEEEQEKREATETSEAQEERKRNKRRAILEEKALRLAMKQSWIQNTVRELERHRKIRETSERRADLQVEIKDLLETLAVEEEKQREAEAARIDAKISRDHLKRRREGLDDILADAMARAGIREDIADMNPKRIEVVASTDDTKSTPDKSSLGSTQRFVPEENAHEERPDVTTQPTTIQAAMKIASLDGMPSGKRGLENIYIDPHLTLRLNADTKTLQKQIQLLEGRLSVSYPRMDVMPYAISSSDNRNTLQTWLRILARRLKAQDQAADELSTEKTEVKAVLDQMVRDHDLNNDAARRMAKRWAEIVQKRGAAVDEVDEAIEEVHETLDMDEFDAGGMSFLSEGSVEEGVEVIRGDMLFEAEEVPLAAQNTEIDAETTRSVEEDVPSTQVDEELDTADMGVAASGDASKTFDPTKGAAPTTNPLVTPKRNQINLSNDSTTRRLYSTSSRPPRDPTPTTSTSTPSSSTPPAQPSLPHLTSSGSAHMVSVSAKAHTVRTAIAVGTVHFSNPTPLALISTASLKKGDVLAVSRIAGIMAAKKCPDLIPLCHPIALTHVGVELRVLDAQPRSNEKGGGNSEKRAADTDMGFGSVSIEAKVQCTGPTGVEMEALTAVMGAALSVVDMCKAVDKFQRVQDVRVVLKEGGKSGAWREEGWVSSVDGE